MTRETFIARWRAHVIGKLALGTTELRSSLKDAFSPGGVAAGDALGRVLSKLPEEADTLLGQLYDCLQPASPKPATNGNGHANGNGRPVVAAKGVG